MYSTIVAGALALPSTSPLLRDAGELLRDHARVREDGRRRGAADFEPLPPSAHDGHDDDRDHDDRRERAAEHERRGLAPSVLRVGGRWTACCRCRRACLPLVIAR